MVSDLDDVWQINQENVPAVGEESIDALAEILEMSSISLVAECEKNSCRILHGSAVRYGLWKS